VVEAQKTLYMQKPEPLRKATEKNLPKTLRELEINHLDFLVATDPSLPSIALYIQVKYE